MTEKQIEAQFKRLEKRIEKLEAALIRAQELARDARSAASTALYVANR